MRMIIQGLLSAEELALVDKTWPRLTFADGRDTAGKAAAAVKRNEQAAPGDRTARALKAMIADALKSNADFTAFAAPKRISPIILSRYTQGMEYGRHVDNPVMYPGGRVFQVDFSFTLFLASPDRYAGGALMLEEDGGETSIRLAAGDVFVYASGMTHRVAPVTDGERRAAVGWVESRNPPQRDVHRR